MDTKDILESIKSGAERLDSSILRYTHHAIACGVPVDEALLLGILMLAKQKKECEQMFDCCEPTKSDVEKYGGIHPDTVELIRNNWSAEPEKKEPTRWFRDFLEKMWP